MREMRARAAALELLRAVKFSILKRRMFAYQHETSRGMCQRVRIAMAVPLHPALLMPTNPNNGIDP